MGRKNQAAGLAHVQKLLHARDHTSLAQYCSEEIFAFVYKYDLDAILQQIDQALEQEEHPTLVILKTRCLNILGRFEALKATTRHYSQKYSFQALPELYIDQAYWMVEYGQYQEAQQVLQAVLPYLEGEHRGRALHRLGVCQLLTGQPDWCQNFTEAGKLVRGRLRGVIKADEAAAYQHSGGSHKEFSRSLWMEALVYFVNEVEMSARINYNIALSYISDDKNKAEAYFLLVDKLSRASKISDLEALAHIGLSAVRRRRGEWKRAIYSSRRGIRKAVAPQVKIAAALSLVHTYKYGKDYLSALFSIKSLQAEFPDILDVQINLGSIFLLLNRDDEALDLLEKIDPTLGNKSIVYKITFAEYWRRRNDVEKAKFFLSDMDLTEEDIIEEIKLYPEIINLLGRSKKIVPMFRAIEKTKVKIISLVKPSILLNDKEISLGKRSRMHEFLVLLKLMGGKCSYEKIGSLMYPNQNNNQGIYDSIWHLMENIRQRFGWKESVYMEGGFCCLDPGAEWKLDLEEIKQGSFVGEDFLPGCYENWVIDTRNCLDGVRYEPDFYNDLKKSLQAM